MKTLQDCFGRAVRLTDERLAHIFEHPEMKDLGAEIERVLIQPPLVRCSRSDTSVQLFYEFYAQTIVGGKWLCVEPVAQTIGVLITPLASVNVEPIFKDLQD